MKRLRNFLTRGRGLTWFKLVDSFFLLVFSFGLFHFHFFMLLTFILFCLLNIFFPYLHKALRLFLINTILHLILKVLSRLLRVVPGSTKRDRNWSLLLGEWWFFFFVRSWFEDGFSDVSCEFYWAEWGAWNYCYCFSIYICQECDRMLFLFLHVYLIFVHNQRHPTPLNLNLTPISSLLSNLLLNILQHKLINILYLQNGLEALGLLLTSPIPLHILQRNLFLHLQQTHLILDLEYIVPH